LGFSTSFGGEGKEKKRKGQAVSPCRGMEIFGRGGRLDTLTTEEERKGNRLPVGGRFLGGARLLFRERAENHPDGTGGGAAVMLVSLF